MTTIQIGWNGELTRPFPPDFKNIRVYLWRTSAGTGAVPSTLIGTLDRSVPFLHWANLTLGVDYSVAFRSVDLAGNLSAAAVQDFTLNGPTTKVVKTAANTWEVAEGALIQIFTEDGVWAKPPGPTASVTAYMIGAGGGGCSGMRGVYGIFEGDTTSYQTCGGDGGGGGERAVIVMAAADLPTTMPVVVGVGGTGGTGLLDLLYNAGLDGGGSSFGMPTTEVPLPPGARGGGGGQGVYTSEALSGIGGGNSYFGTDLVSSPVPGVAAYPGEDGGWGGCHPIMDAQGRAPGENGRPRGLGAGAGGGGGGGIRSEPSPPAPDPRKGVGHLGGTTTQPDGVTVVPAAGDQPAQNGWGGGGGNGGDSGYDETLNEYYAGLIGGAGGLYGAGGGGGGGVTDTVWPSGSGGPGAPGLVIVVTTRGAGRVGAVSSSTWAVGGSSPYS